MLLDRPISKIDSVLDVMSVLEGQQQIYRINVDEKNDCNSCSIRYLCGGGCPILTYRAYQTFNHASPYCVIYKELSFYLLSTLASLYLSIPTASRRDSDF